MSGGEALLIFAVKNHSQIEEAIVRRDLLKTGSFAVLHFSVGFGVAYLISGSLPVAFGVALVEPAVNTVAFFFHERAWARRDREMARAQPRTEDHPGDHPGDHHAVRQLRHMALRG